MYPQQMYKDLFIILGFLPENWEILHIFSIGKGARNGPQNQPRKIPGLWADIVMGRNGYGPK